MKILKTLTACCALAAASPNVSIASTNTTGGFVFCDSNQNGQIDTNDVPLTGVLVVITNQSGTYSNAAFTSTPSGGFIVQLPGPDTYVEYLHPLTLPPDATPVLPPSGVYTFTLNNVNSNFLGNFLVRSATCSSNGPPPCTNGCSLTACGTINSGN